MSLDNSLSKTATPKVEASSNAESEQQNKANKTGPMVSTMVMDNSKSLEMFKEESVQVTLDNQESKNIL